MKLIWEECDICGKWSLCVEFYDVRLSIRAVIHDYCQKCLTDLITQLQKAQSLFTNSEAIE